MSALVYVAGPYTAPTSDGVEANVRRAIDAGHDVIDLGLTPVVPHLSHYLHGVRPRDYEVWMRLDFDLLDRCDYLLRLPGSSSGADREVLHAEKRGIPVFHSVAALASHLLAKGEERLVAALAAHDAQRRDLQARNTDLVEARRRAEAALCEAHAKVCEVEGEVARALGIREDEDESGP